MLPNRVHAVCLGRADAVEEQRYFMLNVPLMAQAIDFVEDHLRDDVTVGDIARAVSLSVYYFCRSFNQATHHTPYDYLMRRRIAEAARDLLQTDRKIIEITFDYHFNSPETFARAFKRVFGMQPTQWRKQGRLDRRLIMPRLTQAHLQHLAQGSYLQPILIERPELHLAGLMTLVQDDPTVIETLWGCFNHSIGSHGDPAERDLYGILHYAAEVEPAGYFYLLGVPIADATSPATTWVAKILPAQTCARFTHKGRRGDLQLTLDYIFHTWLPYANVPLRSSTILLHYGHNHEDSALAETEVFVEIGG
jgi:AraC family transcriptional regulator